ncbi:nuclear RNA export factor 1-like isoform X2 [Amia ocellicauda]|uniref:nuclear RNA export factor 1-like isoform X2 n=1 Tax=Amia ocellicauda TaxID=2972642 RepID=UPI003463F6D3
MVLPRPTALEAETPAASPACEGNREQEEVKRVIMRFLKDYYTVYDSGDRQPLLEVYHHGASFSLGIPLTSENRSRCTLGYYHGSNIRELKDSTTAKWYQLLKHTRLNVVAFLNELPKTQHDTSSFAVDVSTYTNTILSFTVTGVFKEVDGEYRDMVCAFSREFVTVPAGNAGLCVVSDELFVWDHPTPSSCSAPTPTAVQQEMLFVFSQQSGMNLEWSQKCLQDNDWDFNRAAQMFSQLKAQGKIPDVAFK